GRRERPRLVHVRDRLHGAGAGRAGRGPRLDAHLRRRLRVHVCARLSCVLHPWWTWRARSRPRLRDAGVGTRHAGAGSVGSGRVSTLVDGSRGRPRTIVLGATSLSTITTITRSRGWP